jgi:hypothetical protein
VDGRALAAHQRYHLGGEALQALDAFGDGLAAEVKDLLVHAASREGADVTSDVIWIAGEGTAGPVRPRNADIITRRLIGDGQCREIAALRRPSARFSLSRCARILCFGTEADPLPYLI